MERLNLIRNIPTDLLRALVTVVDLKGFTRAGERLGRSQPAISLQIKRLQEMIGTELFDKMAGGAQLSEQGQVVLSYARRILSLNDEMLARLDQRAEEPVLRVGMSEIYAYYLLPKLFAEDKLNGVSQSYEMNCDLSRNLFAGLDEGEFDLVLTFFDEPHDGAYLSWTDEAVWVGVDRALVSPGRPVPLVTYPNDCVLRRVMTETLARASRDYQIVMTTPSLIGLKSALDAGIAVSAISARVNTGRLERMPEDCGLPRLPDLRVGLYIRESDNRAVARKLAERIAGLLGVTRT